MSCKNPDDVGLTLNRLPDSITPRLQNVTTTDIIVVEHITLSQDLLIQSAKSPSLRTLIPINSASGIRAASAAFALEAAESEIGPCVAPGAEVEADEGALALGIVLRNIYRLGKLEFVMTAIHNL